MRDTLFGLESASPEEGTALLTTVHGDAERALVCGILEGEQIPYLAKDRGSGGAVRVITGFSMFGTDLFVPTERLEQARAVLEAYRSAAPVDIDGED